MKIFKLAVAFITLGTSACFGAIPAEYAVGYVGTTSFDNYFAVPPLFEKGKMYIDVQESGTAFLTILLEGDVIQGSGEAGMVGNYMFVKFTVDGQPISGRLALKGTPGKLKAAGSLHLTFGGYTGIVETKAKLKQGPIIF